LNGRSPEELTGLLPLQVSRCVFLRFPNFLRLRLVSAVGFRANVITGNQLLDQFRGQQPRRLTLGINQPMQQRQQSLAFFFTILSRSAKIILAL
jgi:hypothetical protein